MAIELEKALLCARKLRRVLSFCLRSIWFEATGDLSAFGGARFNP